MYIEVMVINGLLMLDLCYEVGFASSMLLSDNNLKAFIHCDKACMKAVHRNFSTLKNQV